MLRFCRLTSHKNNLIIYDFRVQDFVLMSSFCTNVSDSKMLTDLLGGNRDYRGDRVVETSD